MSILSCQDLKYTYQGKYQQVQALQGISCEFEEGKFYAIIGESGSGKTTLLSMLAGLGTPTEGAVLSEDKPISEIGFERYRREKVSVIYQSFNLIQALNILENVMVPMRLSGKTTSQSKDRAAELLSAVGLGEVDSRKLPAMISGGQQQRVAIARALASDAKVILADEPTGNLDSENSKMIIDLLKKLVMENHYCVIVVTHDREIAAQADVVYQMKDGKMGKVR